MEDLREIFEKSIKASCITEPFCSFDESVNAQKVKKFLEENRYDLVGIRKEGKIKGFACNEDLGEGQLSNYFKVFDQCEILPDTATIPEVLNVVFCFKHGFISSFGEIAGIITRGDLQKMPIRMWLFSLISLIEMQMLRIIRERFSEDSWEKLILPKRKTQAQGIYDKRKYKHEEIDLVDCLQFCDKRTIISKTEDLLEKLQTDKKKFCKLLKELEQLRNDLAHAQDIITANWPSIINLLKEAEVLLKKCEDVKPLMV